MGKTSANWSFQSFGSAESGTWQGKILVSNVRFAKFTKIFTRQNFALYGTLIIAFICQLYIYIYFNTQTHRQTDTSLYLSL